MCAVKDGRILHTLALPLAGLMSLKSAQELSPDARQMKQADEEVGLTGLENPLLRIVTLALPVIPAVKMSDLGLVDVMQVWTSSSKALAVMAMIGTVCASGRSSARIRRAAEMPSMTGIRMSMRIASNVPGADLENRSTASRPLTARTVLAPTWVSSLAAISALRSLSSQRRMVRPASFGGVTGWRAPEISRRALSASRSVKSRSSVKVVPSPGWLSTVMVPCRCRCRGPQW